MKFRNCKPNYMWLPLKRKNNLSVSTGELHLRIQWTSDEIDRASDEEQPSWALDVQLNGVGCSLIEANELNFPREVNLAFIHDHITYCLCTRCPASCLFLTQMVPNFEEEQCTGRYQIGV